MLLNVTTRVNLSGDFNECLYFYYNYMVLVAALTIWNQFRVTIKSTESIATFGKKHSKHISLKLLFHRKVSVIPTPITTLV